MVLNRRVLALAGCLWLAACAPPPSAPLPPPAVLVRSVGAGGPVEALQVFTGEVRARVETDLSFRIGGKLVERRVDAGARVARGAELARLDPQDARLAAGAAEAAAAAAAAELALAQSEFERARELHGRQFISASALDTRRTAVRAAEMRHRQMQAQAAAAGNQAAYTVLHADADGVITAALAEAGQVVAAGQPVLRLARPDEREILIHVPENLALAFAPGTPARVSPWAQSGRQYPAVVREVSPAADAATRTYALRVAVPAADDGLPLGATASVAFVRANATGLLLPLSAVARDGNGAAIWVVADDNRVHRVAVEVAEWREDGALLRSGLPQPARVVLAGVHRLVEGAEVRPVEDGAPVQLDAHRDLPAAAPDSPQDARL